MGKNVDNNPRTRLLIEIRVWALSYASDTYSWQQYRPQMLNINSRRGASKRSIHIYVDSGGTSSPSVAPVSSIFCLLSKLVLVFLSVSLYLKTGR